MHPKDKRAFEQIDAMMMNSDSPNQNFSEIQHYLLRWNEKLAKVLAEAREHGELPEADEVEAGTHAELMAKSGFECVSHIPGDTDGPRRREDSNDYNRAQPTDGDLSMLETFLERELANEDKVRYMGSKFHRKLGLLMALQFNRGFDAGVELVRDKNGYSAGYDRALELARARLNAMVLMGKKKSGKKRRGS